MFKFSLRFIVSACVVLLGGKAAVAQQPAPDGGFGFAGYRSPTTVLTAPVATQPPITISPSSAGTASRGVVLLNNDQVVSGEIFDAGQTVQVRGELGIVQLSRGEIALIATTLHDLYRLKSGQTQKNSAEFLKLADWCVTHKLKNEAAYEFDRAILWADNRPLADSIRNRKNAAMSMFESEIVRDELTERESEKYLQWKKQVPPSTFAEFKRDILPMLVQNCSGIACHSADSLNEFRFVGNPRGGDDVDAAKNLQAVLAYVTPEMPEESPLVLVPIAPHGRTKQIFTRRNYGNYEKLYLWVERVAHEMRDYYPLDENDRVAGITVGNRHRGNAPDSENAMTLRHATGGNRVFPTPGESLVGNVTEPSSMAQGMTTSAAPAANRRGDFDFFNQRAIVPANASLDGPDSVRRAVPAHLEVPKEHVVQTHDGLENYEQFDTLQRLRRDPVDPFDPVLFNRQYHFKRIEESLRSDSR